MKEKPRKQTNKKTQRNQVAPCVRSLSVARVIGRRIRCGGVLREGRLRLTVVLWSIVRVSWLCRRDGRGACTCSRVDRVRQPPGLLRRIT